MKIIFLETLKQLNEYYERLSEKSRQMRLGFVWEKLPLISNLSVLENIMLPPEYHDSLKIKDMIDKIKDELKICNISEDILHARRNDLDTFQMFIVKYLQAKFYNPKFIIFMNVLNLFLGEEESKFFDFIKKNGSEKFIFLDYNGYESIYSKNIKYERVDFYQWLIQDLEE